MSTTPKNKYEVLSGTSMSAPYVAAAAALYLGKHETASASEVKNSLIKSTIYVDHFKGRTVSEGRLDIGNLLK